MPVSGLTGQDKFCSPCFGPRMVLDHLAYMLILDCRASFQSTLHRSLYPSTILRHSPLSERLASSSVLQRVLPYRTSLMPSEQLQKYSDEPCYEPSSSQKFHCRLLRSSHVAGFLTIWLPPLMPWTAHHFWHFSLAPTTVQCRSQSQCRCLLRAITA